MTRSTRLASFTDADSGSAAAKWAPPLDDRAEHLPVKLTEPPGLTDRGVRIRAPVAATSPDTPAASAGGEPKGLTYTSPPGRARRLSRAADT